ncbi:hypothetical protein GC176_08275 [bacterium]|nr:hypothetical protein [bacterium]
MNCRFAREMIALWVGNDLSQAEAESVREHVNNCSDCQQHVEALLSSSDVLVSFNAATLQARRDSVWPKLEARIAQSDEAGSSTGKRLGGAFRTIGMISVAALTFLVAMLPDHLRQQSTGDEVLPSIAVSDVSTKSVATPAEQRQGLPRGFEPVYFDSSWQILEVLPDDSAAWQHPGRRGSL